MARGKKEGNKNDDDLGDEEIREILDNAENSDDDEEEE